MCPLQYDRRKERERKRKYNTRLDTISSFYLNNYNLHMAKFFQNVCMVAGGGFLSY